MNSHALGSSIRARAGRAEVLFRMLKCQRHRSAPNCAARSQVQSPQPGRKRRARTARGGCDRDGPAERVTLSHHEPAGVWIRRANDRIRNAGLGLWWNMRTATERRMDRRRIPHGTIRFWVRSWQQAGKQAKTPEPAAAFVPSSSARNSRQSLGRSLDINGKSFPKTDPFTYALIPGTPSLR